MLSTIGAPSIDALFEQIPEAARLKGELNLPSGMPEQAVLSLAQGMAARNKDLSELTCFLGAGAYDHYIPAVVEAVVSMPEFATAYTPYQPEASQGTLQSIFEYQSMVAALTGMDVANASLYDAATGVGEAAIMAAGINKRNRALVLKSVHPHYRQVLTTYTSGMSVEVIESEYQAGTADITVLREKLDDTISCVIVQYPNFFGVIEPLKDLAEAAHSVGALLVVAVDPIALGMLTPPGEFGADIVVGEGQPLGTPLGFGGPYLGLFACKQEYMWKVPGRIVGETTDTDGKKAYTLTLQTREQHIRREKATSNICSNQALVALAANVYMAALGKNGLRQVSELSFNKAHYAMEQICAKPGYSAPWKAPFFKEFVVKSDRPVAEVNKTLLENGILGGYDLGKDYPELTNHILLCVTEKRTKAEIDRLVELM